MLTINNVNRYGDLPSDRRKTPYRSVSSMAGDTFHIGPSHFFTSHLHDRLGIMLLLFFLTIQDPKA
jgi:hypothetical protein